jgi:intein/homing endonuclease
VDGKNRLRECEIKLLAYLLSEGTLGKTFVWFSNKNESIVNDFTQSVKKFDNELEIKVAGKGSTFRVVGTRGKIEFKDIKIGKGGFQKGTKLIVRRNSLIQWLDKLGLKGKRAGEKFIPPIIFTLNNKNIALFLKHLFSCDGSIYLKKCRGKRKQPVVEYSSKSLKLIEGIYYLLLRFGIVSYIRRKKVKGKNYYRLFITNRSDVIKFIKEIGSLKNKEVQNEILKSSDKKYHSNFYLVPKEIWEYIRRKYKKKDIAKALNYKNYKGISTKYKYNPLKLTIKRIGEYFNDEFLKFISSEYIAWVPIKKMQKINEKTKVYDIEVNEEHNFIGNGIILHNSYSAAVILEEFCELPEEYRKKMCFIVIDPMGIYWSMKFPNEQQRELLREWKLEPKGYKDFVKVYIPWQLVEAYKAAKVPFDGTISIAPSEITPSEWFLVFGLKPVEPLAITFEKNYNLVAKKKKDFSLNDLIESIKVDEEASEETKRALISLLRVAEGWGIFSEKGFKIEELAEPGKVVIIDVARMPSMEVRNLLVGLIARKIYHARVASRKEEEAARIEGREPKFTFPLTWFVLEEAHNFIPSDTVVASSEPISILAKQGREPGISLVCISQMPDRIHREILSQCDLVISFRLTAEADIKALHSVSQIYMEEEILKYLNRLPRWAGACLIIDDNLEKLFIVNIRPRLSHHAGATAALL